MNRGRWGERVVQMMSNHWKRFIDDFDRLSVDVNSIESSITWITYTASVATPFHDAHVMIKCNHERVNTDDRTLCVARLTHKRGDYGQWSLRSTSARWWRWYSGFCFEVVIRSRCTCMWDDVSTSVQREANRSSRMISPSLYESESHNTCKIDESRHRCRSFVAPGNGCWKQLSRWRINICSSHSTHERNRERKSTSIVFVTLKRSWMRFHCESLDKTALTEESTFPFHLFHMNKWEDDCMKRDCVDRSDDFPLPLSALERVRLYRKCVVWRFSDTWSRIRRSSCALRFSRFLRRIWMKLMMTAIIQTARWPMRKE